MATTTATLRHVNVPPAQTWNYLHVNGTELVVPPAPESPATPPPPSETSAVEMGSGSEATAWLDASAGRRQVVEVPANAASPSTVVVDVSDDDAVVATDVVVREGAEVTILVTAASAADAARACGSVLRVSAGRNATVHLLSIIAVGDSCTYVDGSGIRLDDGARLDCRQYVLGAGTCALGLACDLAGTGSGCAVTTRYLVGRGQRLDMNYVVRQRGRASSSLMEASGVLAGDAEKTLRATIDLVRGGRGARGRETETVLLAGDDVVSRTLPVILCDEEDVAGDHGATIGSVSPDQLSYLADRGLTEADATALFSRAVIDDAVARATGRGAAAALSAAERVLGTRTARDLADERGLSWTHEGGIA